MFAVPANPPRELLYSKDFIQNVKGFLRCLHKLMSHPRAKLPDNYSILYSLICYYTAIVNAPNVPSSKDNIRLLKDGLKVCAHYENIVARAIPGGKTVAEALAEIAEELRRNNK
ncbi:hypothetical protein L5515_019588 [Caenorhabditis briggsae]|uniref:Uncharacterized protein n=1 Tax=Caenorhabditis briggsae TaxID=6238 RepID=A0AAE9FK60_CAEBR|nr:hypothetical protein L5515_019588 [Caenorhabditis briggsae]